MRKTSDKPNLRASLQNTLPVFKIVKVIKKQGKPEKLSKTEKTQETKCNMVSWMGF